MKKNRMMRLASGLLVAVLLTTCVISGTFAKYVSEAEATDTARVAKWNVSVVDKDSQNFTFNLFNTIKDSDGQSNETDVDADLIAPGTSGEFEIALSSDSEVTFDYKVDYTVTNDGDVPILFSVDGHTWTDDLADVTGTIAATADLYQDIKVQWKWDFGENVDDNPHGTGQKTVTVAVKVTFTQVD